MQEGLAPYFYKKMGKIELNGKKAEIDDGESIVETCRKLGVSFGCKSGLCMVCHVEVEEGMENLSDPTIQESQLGMEETRRLACQCKLKQGFVKLKY